MSGTLHFYDFHPALANFKEEVLTGLSQTPKSLAPKFFYDRKGSELFDAITELSEYYPTRTEIKILEQHTETMAELLGRDCLLLELGSGSSKKIRVLLDALKPAVYMPLDISKEHLLGSARALAADYPTIEVHAACADYTAEFDLPYKPKHMPRVAFFPGSSIGNFEPAAAKELLERVGEHVGEGGKLLIGVDLKKDHDILNEAYNDSQQVTADFNLNLLRRINRELDANFDIEAFSHKAFFNAEKGRIEMHLVSKKQQTATVAETEFAFALNESIHTENSYKYTIEEFQRLAADAGFKSEQTWTDKDRLFSVHCLAWGGQS